MTAVKLEVVIAVSKMSLTPFGAVKQPLGFANEHVTSSAPGVAHGRLAGASVTEERNGLQWLCTVTSAA